jgi:Squalene-hopene cyclase C-terminal domain
MRLPRSRYAAPVHSGTLTDGHLRAVIRLALVAYGLCAPTDGAEANAGEGAEGCARVCPNADGEVETNLDGGTETNADGEAQSSALRDVDLYTAIDAAAGELAGLVANSPTGELRELMLREIRHPLGRPLVESQIEGVPSVAVLATAKAQLQRATDALVAEAERGFAQSGHSLRFPRGKRGETRHETHTATLLFRAVTLDALLDAKAAGLAVCDRVLSREGMALLKAKHPGVRGGWSYFETVPELPPDADDLGQVLQALARLGGPELALACEEPLQLALDAGSGVGVEGYASGGVGVEGDASGGVGVEGDASGGVGVEGDASGGVGVEGDAGGGAGGYGAGGFPTWILDPALPGRLDRIMSAYVSVIGGTGVHPEVVANLLVGLLYYDPARFAHHLQRGVGYLERTQDPGGWWESRWYAGRFYGTFKAAAVLGRLAPGGDAARRARAFLLASREDGGRRRGDGGRGGDGAWGQDTSDPLATAHALLACAALGGIDHGVRAAAAECLLAQQRSDGTWPPSPWVQFPTLDGLQSHSSSTISTAFALKACLAWN